MNRKVAYLLAPLAMLALPVAASAQQPAPAIKATVLATQPVAGLPDRELLIIAAELPPGATSGLHTHPGDENGTVIEGTVMVKVGTEDFKSVSAGQTFSAKEGTPMEIKNAGTQPAKVINVLINQKGKPRSTPVHTNH